MPAIFLGLIPFFLFWPETAATEPYQPDGSGQVVIEAEHFDLNVSRSDRDWVADFTPGYVGDRQCDAVGAEQLVAGR
jgi:hypothetical protein